MIAQVLGQLDHDAIVGLDGEDRIFFFDQGAETVSGYRAGDMIGRPVSTVLPVTARFVDAGEGTDPVGALWPLANDKPRRHSRAKGRLAP